MNTPRIGDTVIFSDMAHTGLIVAHDREKVMVKPKWGRRRRTIKLSKLECVDHDAGLWQEMK